MKTPNEVSRLYNIQDADMLQLVKMKHGFFKEDKSSFAAFDADFTGSFESAWLSEIEDADLAIQDVVVRDQQRQLTNTVEDLMDRNRSKFQVAKYFIEKAFPDDKAVQDEFGFNDYLPARRGQSRMIRFMTAVHQVAVKYSGKLIAVGYTQQMIDEIETLKNDLDNADQSQELFKKDRPVITQDRIKKLNKAWETTVNVCRVGKIIFQSDFSRHEKYLLPKSVSSTSDLPPPDEGPEPLGEVGT